MRNLILIMLGGAVGAGFRYRVGTLALRRLERGFPSLLMTSPGFWAVRARA